MKPLCKDLQKVKRDPWKKGWVSGSKNKQKVTVGNYDVAYDMITHHMQHQNDMMSNAC